MDNIKKGLQYIFISVFAFLSAVNYNIFVFPNSFAPAGIDGICTMIQDLSGVSIGYLSLVVNIPLLAAAVILDREYVSKTAVYVFVFSAASLFLKHTGIERFSYHTESGTSIVLAPVAAGTIRGILYAVTLKNRGSSGGADIIAALVKHRWPHLNLMNIIFTFNLLVAVSSYFAYGFKIEPVICSIIYSFITSAMSNNIRSTENETIKFEVITEEAHSLCTEISRELGLSATIVSATGSYSGENKEMVICVMTKNNVPPFEKLVERHKGAVMFKSVVNNSLADI